MENKTENPTYKAPKDAVDLISKANKVVNDTGTLTIKDNAGYEHAAVVLKDYTAQEKALLEKQKSLIDPLNVTKNGVWDLFKSPLDFLGKGRKKIKAAMITYQDKLENERLAEEKRLEAIAEKERKYQEGLAKKRLETATKNDNEDRIEEIEEEIEEIQHTSVAPVVASNRPKIQGVSTRVTWSAELTDKMALIKAVAAGLAPETLLDVNMPTANQMARAMKSHLNYPGIKAVSKKGIAA